MLDAWDDTYTGPRWRYVLLARPLLVAAPKGFIFHSDRPHADSRFGSIDYPRALTPEACRIFGLRPIAAPPGGR